MQFRSDEEKKQYYRKQVKQKAGRLVELADDYGKGGDREKIVKQMMQERRVIEEAIFQLQNYVKF